MIAHTLHLPEHLIPIRTFRHGSNHYMWYSIHVLYGFVTP